MKIKYLSTLIFHIVLICNMNIAQALSPESVVGANRQQTSYWLELPVFISSNMVMQRGVPLQLTGWGTAGEQVKVTFTRNGVNSTAIATINTSGKWIINLDAQTAETQPCTLRFELVGQPQTAITLSNILIGDVWMAGGQSNMEKKVSHLIEANQVIAESNNYPLIRAFRTGYNAKNQLQEKTSSGSAPWIVCNSSQVGDNVSAVAYIFAREIYKSQQIPIGILQAYRGGTELETWLSRKKITSDAELCKVSGRIQGMDSTNAANYPSINYNGQIYPLRQFPIKGFIFYQGESNTKRALEYRLMMKKLMEDWRSDWGMGDLPFYYVQMFNMGISTNQLYEEGNWQDIREQQELLLTVENISNIGMAVTIDTNDDPDNADANIRIHPKNKLPVGERLARIALKKTYLADIEAESPRLVRYQFSNDSVILIFKHAGQGLQIRSGETELKGFVVAGADKIFKAAVATIINDSTVLLKSSQVVAPVAARYGWSKNPVANLTNSAGLPTGPFRTDIWKSGFSYDKFNSSCALSNDASLVQIRINGIPLAEFQPEITEYSLSHVDNQIPDIKGFSRSPFATITSTNIPVGSQRKYTLTVTAENGLQRQYHLTVNIVLSLSAKNNNNGLNVFVSDKALMLENQSGEAVTYNVFDSSGRYLTVGELASKSRKQLNPYASGLYFVVFTSGFLQKAQKLVLY
jgi:sialate O-acetylesterase